MTIVAFSGHRPNKIGGYNTPNPIYNYITSELTRVITELKPSKAVSGMALGVDQIAAEVCIKLGVPFTAAVPFRGQELAWPATSQKRYSELLGLAESVEYVSPGGYAAWKMQTRNQFMVDMCDILVAVFDGTPGGTKNCIDYAASKNKRIIRINPLDFKGQ